ncbi:unnamed protein product [Ectocarpus sp. 13 AM-2016]
MRMTSEDDSLDFYRRPNICDESARTHGRLPRWRRGPVTAATWAPEIIRDKKQIISYKARDIRNYEQENQQRRLVFRPKIGVEAQPILYVSNLRALSVKHPPPEFCSIQPRIPCHASADNGCDTTHTRT